MYIYADNAGTTKMSPVAIDAMTKCMNEVFGNPSMRSRSTSNS